MPPSLRLAHLSDPHFARISLHPNQFLSKRWIGNINLILLRSPFYHITPLFHFPDLMDHHQVHAVCCTGDFATTSLPEEFQEAKNFIKDFNIPVFTVPGNHDCYTKEAEEKKMYYHYFPDHDLEKERVSCKKIKDGWWWIGLDCTLATPPFCAYGKFFSEMHQTLERKLKEIPKSDFVVINNHFPLYPSGDPKHDLRRAKDLQKLLQGFSNVKLYLHGHDHLPYIIERKEQNLPIVFNSGSCARKRGGGFTLLDLNDKGCHYRRFAIKKSTLFEWDIEAEGNFLF